jgi:hypothetical protein
MKSNLEFNRRAGVVTGLVSRKTGREPSSRGSDSRDAVVSRLGCHVRRATAMHQTKGPIQTQPDPNDSLD